MRQDSALQVIAFLRKNLGQPVSIWEVCQGIDLSYQPTYAHIRELEKWGVVVAERQGRQVCCTLARSDAAAIWLALESERRWREIKGWSKRLGESLRSDLTQALRSKLLAVVVNLGSVGAGQRVWVLVAEPSAKRQAEEISRRVRERWQRDLEVAVGTADDLARWVQEESPRQTLFGEALPIYGRERFWELMLASIPAGSSYPSPPSLPPLRNRHKREEDFID